MSNFFAGPTWRNVGSVRANAVIRNRLGATGRCGKRVVAGGGDTGIRGFGFQPIFFQIHRLEADATSKAAALNG